MRYLIPACFALALTANAGAAEAVLILNGEAKTAIFVPARLLDDAVKNPEPPSVWYSLKAEDNRRRLRESVKDLATILERISGAKVAVEAGPPPAGDTRLPILIGELAAEKFGKPTKNFPYQQGFRLVSSAKGVGLAGESDLATSYAIYTLLDQIGCRWFIPGPLGEVLPSGPTVRLKEQDISTGPATIYRGLWYCDADYGRRNRLGGLVINAGHNIEFAVPKELRKTHPEVRAVIGGKPHDHLIKWTHPLVADALSEACLAAIKADPELKTYSLSPDDGASWDESDDAKLDAGDRDPGLNCIAKADRLMVLTNRVATRVTKTHPDMKFGMLAYADYTRPPVREKPHPAIVPQIAPITFSRAQPITDDGEPNNKTYRSLVEGWGSMVEATSYYFYGYYLAEVSTPNPMIKKWSTDIPYVYSHGKCRYWQPETMTNFETSMHALYLGLRMAWDTTQDPKAIIDDLHTRFYGHAAQEMAAYWHSIDRVWTETPEYAGCGFGHRRRWTPGVVTDALKLLATAERACERKRERDRVQMAVWSLRAFEKFMTLMHRLDRGEWDGLDKAVAEYRDLMIDLGEQYQSEYAFAKMTWTGKETVNVRYFDAFFKATYDDAARIARDFKVLTARPLTEWKFLSDPMKKGEAAGWMKPDYGDADWKKTSVPLDTWSALGLHNYLGSAWYRTKVNVPAGDPANKTFLWIGSTDGLVKVFVNGTHVPYVGPKGEKADSFTGFCQPASFDISAALKAGENQMTLFCTREAVNELGTGGLLAAPVIYRKK